MATIKRVYVFASCVLSGIAAIVIIISLATEEWVVTDSAKWINVDKTNIIKYGLFQGFFRQEFPTPRTLQITMTCLAKENVCALLCGGSSNDRYLLLEQLYYNNANASQDDGNCVQLPTIAVYKNTLKTDSCTDCTRKFINYGVWVSTILFLAISLLFGALSSALSLYNTVSNPTEVYLSILGIYIYNSVALCSTVIAMALWGVMHLLITFYDVGVFYTLTGQMTSEKTASLGYSYWILFVPVIFYFASVLVLYVRQYLINKDPGQKIVERDETADPGLYLY